MPISEEDALGALALAEANRNNPAVVLKAKDIAVAYKAQQKAAGLPMFPKQERAREEQYSTIKGFYTDPNHGLDEETLGFVNETLRGSEDSKYKIFNKKYFEFHGIPKDQVDSQADQLINAYGLQEFKKPISTHKEFFDSISADFKAEKQVEDMAREFTLAKMSPLDSEAQFRERMASVPGYAGREAKWKDQFLKNKEFLDGKRDDYKNEIWQLSNGIERKNFEGTVSPVARFSKFGGAEEPTEARLQRRQELLDRPSNMELAEVVMEVPAEDRPFVIAAAAADAEKDPNGRKDFMLNFVDQFTRGFHQYVEGFPLLEKKTRAIGIKGLIRSGFPISEEDAATPESLFAAAASALKTQTSAGLSMMGDLAPISESAPSATVSEETKAGALKLADRLIEAADLTTAIRNAAEQDVDPITSEFAAVRGMYALAGSAPYMVAAAIPGGALLNTGAYAELGYQMVRSRNPEMSAEQAMGIGAIAAPFMAYVERLQFRTATGQLTNLNRFYNQVIATKGGVAPRFLGRTAATVGLEMVQENIQDVTPFVVQGIISAVSEDMPNVPVELLYKDMLAQQPELFFAVLPLAVMGGGAGTYSDFRNGRALLSSYDELRAHGLSEAASADIRALANQGDYDGAQSLLREEFKTLGQDQKSVQEARVEALPKLLASYKAQSEALQSGIELDILPAILQQRDGKVALRYNDGTEVSYDTHAEAMQRFDAIASSAVLALHRDSITAARMTTSQMLKGREVKLIVSPLDPTTTELAEQGVATEEQLQKRKEIEETDKGITPKAEEARARALTGIAANSSDAREAASYVLGSSQNTEAAPDSFGDRVIRTTARVYARGTPFTVIEEIAEGDIKFMITEGKVSRQWIISALRQWETTSNDSLFRKSITDDSQIENQDIVEAYSKMVVSYFAGRAKAGDQGRIFSKETRDFVAKALRMDMNAVLTGYASLFEAVYRRAAMIEKARKERTLPADLESFLSKSAGMSPQRVFEREVVKEGEGIAEEMGVEFVDEETFSTISDFSSSRAVPANADTVTVLPDGARLVGPTTFSIMSFHGTPHKVDKFNTANIGTGEGAQAYGWGLYFAEDKGVAKYYRDALSAKTPAGDRFRWNQQIQYFEVTEAIKEDDGWNTKEELLAILRQRAESKEDEWGDPQPENDYQLAADLIESGAITVIERDPGNLYTVELLPDADEFLDWDKPLSEQSERVQGIIASADFSEGMYANDGVLMSAEDIKGITGRSVYTQITTNLWEPGSSIDKRKASEILLSLGIPGIRYLDGNSRNAGEGTYNYVIFDDKLIKIIEENGERVDAGSTFSTITPAVDAEYLALAADPVKNQAKLQRMVDAAARAAGLEAGTSKTNGGKGAFGLKGGSYFGKAISVEEANALRDQFAQDYDAVGFRVQDEKEVNLPVEGDSVPNSRVWGVERDGEIYYDEYLDEDAGNVSVTRDAKYAIGTNHGYYPGKLVYLVGGYSSQLNHWNIDAGELTIEEGVVLAVFGRDKPFGSLRQIKSADPVTYDESGNVIPLSQRFNPARDEISFSVIKSYEYLRDDNRFDKLQKEGRVVLGAKIEEFIDKHILLHSPDNAFSGVMRLTDGSEIKGTGGVYYPSLFADDNYFWASTEDKAKQTANHLNIIGEKNGGRIFMALVSAPVEKLFSSSTMARGTVTFFNALAAKPSKSGITKDDLNKMLEVASKVVVQKKSATTGKVTPKQFSFTLSSNDSLKKNLGLIADLVHPKKSIFDVRKAFSESLAQQVAEHLKGNESASKYVAGILADAENKHANRDILKGKLAKASIVQGLGHLFTEPFLRDFQAHGNGRIYAILEVEGEVEAIPSDLHESYPYAIVPKNRQSKVILHKMDKAYRWQDTVGYETGGFVEEENFRRVMPTGGTSSTKLKVLGPKVDATAPEISFSVIRPIGDIDSRFTAMFSPFQRSPELRAKLGIAMREKTINVESELAPIIRAFYQTKAEVQREATALEKSEYDRLLRETFGADTEAKQKALPLVDRKAARSDAKRVAKQWMDGEMKKKEVAPREVLIGFLRTLDAIQRTLPVEVRGKIGGFVALAELSTPAAMLDEIERRVERIDKELELYLKKEFRSKLKKVFKKAEARKKAGKSDEGKIGPMGHAWFDYAAEVAGMHPVKLEAEIVALEARMAKPDGLSKEDIREISAWVGAPVESEQIALDYLEEKLNIATTIGGTLWGNIRSGSKDNRNTLTAEDISLAAELAENVYTGGRINRLKFVTERRERREALREGMIKRINGAANDPDRIRQRNKDNNNLLRMLENAFDESLDFSSRVEDILGGGPEMREILSAARNAENSEKDAIRARQIEFKEFVQSLFPKMSTAKRLVALEKLAIPKDVPGVSIKAVPAFMSELQAVHYTMLWRDDASKEWLESQGYNKAVIDGLENFISPDAIKIREWLHEKYEAQYFRINEVYRRIKGVNLPRVAVYAPRMVEHMNQQIEGDLTTSGGMAGHMSTAFTNRRVQTPRGEPKPLDALVGYWSNAFMVEHYIAQAEFMGDLRATLGSKDVRLAIESKRGQRLATQLMQVITAIDEGGVKSAMSNTIGGKFLRRSSEATARGSLAYNIGTILKQFPAAFASVAEIGPVQFWTSLGRINSGKAAISPKDLRASATVQRRKTDADLEMSIAMKGGTRPILSLPGQLHFRVLSAQNWGMDQLGNVDASLTGFSAAIAYDAHYRAAIKAGLSEEAARKVASDQMEETIARTAQSDSVTTKSLFELSLGDVGRLLFMFQGPNRQAFAITYLAAKRALKGESKAKLANVLFLYWFVVPTLMQTIGNLMQMATSDDDWDEVWDIDDYLRSWALGPLSGALWAGPTIEAAVSLFGGFEKRLGESPITAAGETLKRLYALANDEDVELKDITRAVDGIAKTVGGDAAALSIISRLTKQAYGVYQRVTE